MTTAANIKAVLRWSEPTTVKTVRGVRNLHVATPTPVFWGLWRTDKAALVAAGITCGKNPDTGNWEVYLDPAKATAAVSAGQGTTTTAKPAAGTSRKEFVWSVEQQAIFAELANGTGHFVVFARAGTGKTTTIKYGFSHVPASYASILYVVFNKKNQLEAKEVIDDPRVDCRTWGSVGYRMVTAVWPAVKPNDDVEADRVAAAVGMDTAQEVKTAVLRLVAFAKNTTVAPTVAELAELAMERDIDAGAFEDAANGGWDANKLAGAAARVLELSLTKDAENRISFNDQVWLPVVKGWVTSTYDVVVVDECQDMNAVQLLMAKKLVKASGRLVIVGDDRQAIYNFRGADTDGMHRMKAEMNMKELKLTVTRRCPKAVVALAKAIVPDYQAADDAPEGVVEHVAEAALLDLCKPGDAVLSRINAPLMSLCLQLLRRGIAARIEGRDLGKALAAVVRKLNAKSVPHFLTKLENWATKQKARFKGTKRYETKCEEINDTAATLEAVAEGAASVAEIEVRLGKLFQDSATATTPAVVLSSVHKAKGLEWAKVYLLEKTFRRKRPASAPAMTPAEVKEEANIRYVALTRAKATLVLAQDVGAGAGRG